MRRARACGNAPEGHVRKLSPDTYGYIKVGLCRDGRYHHPKVHRLVALAFLGPAPFDDAVVAHWDGDPTNNRVENLRWATRVENEADKARHGRVHQRPTRRRSKWKRLDVRLVRQLRKRAGAGTPISELAAEFEIHRNTAYCAVHGLTWAKVVSPPPLPRATEVRHAA